MKKHLILLLAAVLVISCQQNPDSLEGKKAMLEEKQKELATLQEEVNLLEAEIAEMDTTATEEATSVEIKELSTETFEHFVKLTGTVSSKENIMISAETTGRVEAIPAVEGQKVSRGAVLVRIENEAVSNQLQEAKSSFELAEVTFQKRQKLWDQKIGSEIEYLQAKNAFETTKSRYAQIQTQYNNTVIKAPINGVVDDVAVKEGEFVSMGSPIVRVVDLEKVEIEAELSEQYLKAIKKGDSVKVEMPAIGITRMAPVTFVSQVINPDNRSFKIKVNLANKDGEIKPNVLANLMIRDYKNDSAIVVPSTSINKDLKGDFVYLAVQGSNGLTAEKRYVKKGSSFGATTEIKEGLKAGDKVITVGYNMVNDGEIISLN
jgi:RND family efflux transporter MFP subunit